LRYLPYLSDSGYIVTSTTPFVNIPNYPDLEKILDEIKKQHRVVAIDADEIAQKTGNIRASNVVMLGAASPFVHIESSKIEEAIKRIFERKGESIADLNLQAYMAGRQFTLDNIR